CCLLCFFARGGSERSPFVRFSQRCFTWFCRGLLSPHSFFYIVSIAGGKVRFFQWCAIASVLLALQACSVIRLSDNLPKGVLENNDPVLVAEALPAYMVTIDGLIANWPEKPALLQSGASLYSVYSSLVVQQPERRQRLSNKALTYDSQ